LSRRLRARDGSGQVVITGPGQGAGANDAHLTMAQHQRSTLPSSATRSINMILAPFRFPVIFRRFLRVSEPSTVVGMTPHSGNGVMIRRGRRFRRIVGAGAPEPPLVLCTRRFPACSGLLHDEYKELGRRPILSQRLPSPRAQLQA
jgi:hypothetical protein